MKKLTLLLVSAVLALFAGAVPGFANTTPNSFTPVGDSWIDALDSEKVWLEDFNLGNQDDTNIFYVPSGVTCIINGVTATGPFLAGDDYDDDPDASNCSNADGAYDPIDPSNGRVGAHPIGFDVNFFGTTYSDLYFSENGGIWLDNPTSRYDRSLTYLAVDNQTTLIAPLAIDLYYDEDESSIWTAQTTVSGKDAFIISWQELDECCTSVTPDTTSASFQFVFIDEGSGDFTAYFNYDDVTNIDQGYDPILYIDMANNVTVGSNVVTADTVAGLRDGVCEAVSDSTVGTSGSSLTDSSWDNNANYMKIVSASDNTISVWTDSDCTNPNNISAVQDLATDGAVYVGLQINNLSSSSNNAIAIGWGTFDPTTKATNITELFANQAKGTLFNDGATPLRSYSLNTEVPGRIVLGQVGGVTVGDPTNPDSPAIGSSSAPSVREVPYYGPVNLVVDPKGLANGTANVTGSNLGTVARVSVNGIATTFKLNAEGTITFDIPDLPVGRYAVHFFVPINQVTLVSSIEITGRAALVQSGDQKVNAGTFGNYVAVYAKGFAGSTLTWKIAGKWFTTELTEDYQVFQRPTIYRNYAINVELFIDGKRLLEKSVLTK